MSSSNSHQSTNVRFGIRQKMVLVLVIVLVTALGLAGWYTYQQQEEDILGETKRRGDDVTRFLSQAVAMQVIGYDYHGIQLLLDEFVTFQDIVYARVDNKKGKPMGQAETKTSNSAHWLTFEQAIVFDNQQIGTVTVGLDNKRIVQRLEKQRLSLIGGEAITIILIAVGEFLALSLIIVRPVSIVAKSLSDGVDKDGKITADIPIQANDEFGLLARLFNNMREELNQANAQLQTRIATANEKLQENHFQLLKQSAELQISNEELKHLSITDPLTKLYNRRHFESVLSTDMALNQRHNDEVCLVIIDIDHFKMINDTFGHAAGDAILVELASVLEDNLRKTDTLCRIGGEEFVAICRRASSHNATLVSEKLREKVEAQQFVVDDKIIPLTISVGVDSLTNSTSPLSADEFFRRADRALYYSKEQGRNRVTHFQGIPDHLSQPITRQGARKCV